MNRVQMQAETSDVMAASLIKLDLLDRNGVPSPMTRYGRMLTMVHEASMSPEHSKMIELARDLAQTVAVKAERDRQYARDTRFEKWVHKSPSAEARDNHLAKLVEEGTGIAFDWAVGTLHRGTKSWLHEKELETLAEHIWATLAFAGQDANGSLPMHNEMIVFGALKRLKVSSTFVRTLANRPPPKKSTEIPMVNLPEPVKLAVAYKAGLVVGTNHEAPGHINDRTLLAYFEEVIGLSKAQASQIQKMLVDCRTADIDRLGDLCQSALVQYSYAQQKLIDMQLPNVPIDNIQAVAKRLAAYDPNRERREAVQTALKTGAVVITIAAVPYLDPVAGKALAGVASALLGGDSGAPGTKEFLKLLEANSAA